MSHYEHPEDEGWIPREITRDNVCIELTPLINIACRECDYAVIVRRNEYKIWVDQHIQEHKHA